jgi:ABC-type dipeptide/oligopeptide/nickel transport system permease subunit
MVIACIATLPWTLAPGPSGVPRYNEGDPGAGRLPPSWIPHSPEQVRRAVEAMPEERRAAIAAEVAARFGVEPGRLLLGMAEDSDAARAFRQALERERPRALLGTDLLGRSLLLRALVGGGISLGIGFAAALIAVGIGTLYGAISGYAGGLVDAVLMRIVDVLYGLPYILLVVLLAVASDAVVGEYVTRAHARADWISQQVRAQRDAGDFQDTSSVESLLASNPARAESLAARALEAIPPRKIDTATRAALDVATLLLAIGGVSWLTLARVVRGQVLSLKNQPFVEAARAAGASPTRIFARHLLPNLLGPIVVYATLTVPQAILQESFLSFLGIGVKPPLPSWGNLAAEGLGEVNPYRSHWWLLAVPSVLLGTTLLALNFVGEGLREVLDPRRSERNGTDA